jgi:hypothetical protein
LNADLDINDKRHVYRYVGKRGEQRRLWLMDFIYLHEIKTPLKIVREGSKGRAGGGDLTNV